LRSAKLGVCTAKKELTLSARDDLTDPSLKTGQRWNRSKPRAGDMATIDAAQIFGASAYRPSAQAATR
jgi:hypothetical protein